MTGIVRALFLSGLILFSGALRADIPAGGDSGNGRECPSGGLWMTAGFSISLIGAAFLGDRYARDWARDHQNSRANRVLTSAEMMGQWQSAIPVLALYAGGIAFRDGQARDAAVSAGVASIAGAGLVTQAIKYSFGRARPRQNLGIRNFRPFSGDVSFPSGHTAQAFSVVAAVSETYQNILVSVPLYAVATMTGMARIYHDAHFLSDVTAGAVIGTLSGVYAARYIRNRGKSRGVSIAPMFQDGISGGMVSLAF